MGDRFSTGLINITAVWAGVAGAITNTPVLWTLSAGKRAVIRKLRWRNRTGGAGNLIIGFGDRTVAGSLFRQVFPWIMMVNGIDDGLDEDLLPIMGNYPQGFCVDTTAVTGTAGAIRVATDAAGVAVATPVEVIAEIEEL